MSEPVHSGRRLAASAAAEPPDEPPAMRLASKGLPVAPQTGLRLFPPAPISGTFVLARIIAPAARRRPTISVSSSGTKPRLRGRCRRWSASLWYFANPLHQSATRRAAPWACQLPTLRGSCCAAQLQPRTSIAAKAFTLGLEREISSMHAARYSLGVKLLASKAARTSHAETLEQSLTCFIGLCQF